MPDLTFDPSALILRAARFVQKSWNQSMTVKFDLFDAPDFKLTYGKTVFASESAEVELRRAADDSEWRVASVTLHGGQRLASGSVSSKAGNSQRYNAPGKNWHPAPDWTAPFAEAALAQAVALSAEVVL